MVTLPDFKKGDTFRLKCRVPIAFGNILTSARAHIRVCGNKIAELSYAVGAPLDPADFTFTLSATAAQTELWKVGLGAIDIEYTTTEGVVSTETFYLPILGDVTE